MSTCSSKVYLDLLSTVKHIKIFVIWLICSNGQLIFTDPNNPDCDEDGLLDGEEIEVTYGQKYIQGVGNEGHSISAVYFTYKSNPNNHDSDNDGILDSYDTKPLEKFDNHFKIIKNYDCDYYDLLSDNYKNSIDNSPQFSSKQLSNEDNDIQKQIILTKLENILMALGGHMPISSVIISGGSNYGPTPTGASLLSHYINASGDDYCIDNFPYSVALVDTQRLNYYNNINSFMDMVEENVIPQKNYIFSTTTDNIWNVNYHGLYRNNIEVDWWLTIGGGQNALVADVVCNEDNNTISYTAKIKYYVLDYYDWDPIDEKELYDLHIYGLAQFFVDYGVYETEITWQKGSRFPKYEFENQVILEELEFEGITDSKLKQAYSNGMMYYINQGVMIVR